MSNGFTRDCAAAHGHGAGTPLKLCEWWTRYIVPPEGNALHMFCGTGTSGVAAVSQGKTWTGIELDAGYAEIANQRVSAAIPQQNCLFAC